MVELLFSSFIVDILIIAVSFVVLNFASNIVINNAVKVSSITRLGKTAVGFSIIAFSTSLPELTVAFIAAFSGGAALSVGNVLGSNIVNISVIVGIAAFLVYFQYRRRAKRSKEPICSRLQHRTCIRQIRTKQHILWTIHLIHYTHCFNLYFCSHMDCRFSINLHIHRLHVSTLKSANA